MTTQERIRGYIEEQDLDEPILLFESPNYETAFIGLDYITGRAIYDYDKMIEYLITDYHLDHLEAIEFFEFNTARSLPYYNDAPIILKSWGNV